MRLGTDYSIRARALAGFITFTEIELIEGYANTDSAGRIRQDSLRALRGSLLKAWNYVFANLGDPFDYKVKWDERAESARAAVSLKRKLSRRSDNLKRDVAPAYHSFLESIKPSITVINPQLSTRYVVGSI